MKLPTSSAGLFDHRMNVRPLRLTLDRAALDEGLEIRGCVGCGTPVADGHLDIAVARTLPSWWAVGIGALAVPFVAVGSLALAVMVTGLLRRSSLVASPGAAVGIGLVVASVAALVVVGGLVVMLRPEQARLRVGRCAGCRQRARVGATAMAIILGLLLLVPLGGAIAVVTGVKLTDGAALITMLSGSATSLVLCVLLHQTLWQQRVFTVHAEPSRRGVTLIGGPKLAEVFRVERPEVVRDVEVLGRVGWRATDVEGVSRRARGAASSSRPAATTR
jgi:hypothetical protein